MRLRTTIEEEVGTRAIELANVHGCTFSQLAELALAALVQGVGTWSFTDVLIGEGLRGKVIQFRYEERSMIAIYTIDPSGAGYILHSVIDRDTFADRYVIHNGAWAPLMAAVV